MIEMPNFFKSKYFVPETDNWHLLDGAPKEIIDEFEEYMKREKENEKKGIFE